MNKIRLLPEQLINQIAAGEVVERPASVVKELVENSIDAGASKVIVEITDGGLGLIKITDNGCGMNRDDAMMALERHATSKIASIEDLQNILTMGFRGEAIASIASVSKFIMRSKVAEENAGIELVVEGGKMLRDSAIGMPVGTEIEVRELFFNTPARLKFMKTEQTEYQNVVDTVVALALAFPMVSFKLIGQEKVVFDLPSTEEELVRIRGLLGKGIADEMIEVFYGGMNLKMTGYIGKPSVSRASKSMQYLFVNGRPITSHVLAYAVKQAYHSLLPKERYPVFVVKFELEPSMVDVNTHPRKTEVKFRDEREIYRVLTNACQRALENNVLAPKVANGEAIGLNYYQEKKSTGIELPSFKNEVKMSATIVVGEKIIADNQVTSQDRQEFKKENVAEFIQQLPLQNKHNSAEAVDENKVKEIPIIPLAQLNNAFILCQRAGDLIIIDQHAAHERIRYEKLMAEGENEEKATQQLLMPVNIDLAEQDRLVLESNREVLNDLGLNIEHFGGKTYSITAVPSYLTKSNLEKILLGLIDDLRSMAMSGAGLVGMQGVKGDFFARKEKILTYLACRSAVKFGDPLTREEMQALIDQLAELPVGKATCPHGRPTMIVMEWGELWSRFGRKYTGFFEEEKYRDVNC
ncbi:DNA mismatch repair endonuclease MutL [Candidatus Peregrinibacteria bacterium]|nr:DNA mismatch repair endonuclease MutL [Candidatus Peregrinibacteria bacterium]